MINKKKVVAWTLHCENPECFWSWTFEDEKEFKANFDERARWGECAGVTYHYEDGTKKKYEMDAWSS